jgi:hypothetical protein
MSKWLSKRRRLLPLAILPALLSACETVSSSQPPSACPEVVDYSAAWQSGLADELERLPADYTYIPQLVVDYGRLRAEIRACK